jgi:hypothetical protein
MKKFLSLSTVAMALSFAVNNAIASNPLVSSNSYYCPSLNISGTLKEPGTNYVKKGVAVQTAVTECFNNSTIYFIISNAVAQSDVSGIPATNLPANSYLLFNPNGSDGLFNGTFTVTNKNGLSYPLSGLDGNRNYYSYIELDTDNSISGILGFDLGLTEAYGNDFNDVYSYDGKSQEDSSTAVFYVHDNPYAYDAADALAWAFGIRAAGPQGLSCPNPTGNNFQNSIEIKGILTVDSTSISSSATFHGKGNALINGAPALVTHGEVSVQ